MLRTHDVVLTDGTFRVILTPKHHVVAVLDAPITMLGPIHAVIEIDRSPFLPSHIPESALRDANRVVVAGLFDDIGGAISKAAEGAFNTVSHAATTIARPAFDVLKHVAGEGAHLVAQVTPFLPSATRHQMDQAAHLILRAHLGDMTAKQFIRTIGSAAKAGVKAAQGIGDTLLDASKLVAKTIDVPVLLASQIPGLGGILKSLSPLERFQHMATALQKGDFDAIKKMAEQDLSLAQSVISLVPGVGTGVSAAIGAGLAALEGGSPLAIAIRTAYGAIPIPPGIRQVTDVVLDAVLALLEHPDNLSELAIQVARDHVPSGLPRDVFDTLVNLIARKMPIHKAAGSIVDHYVHQYTPAATAATASPSRMMQPLHLLTA